MAKKRSLILAGGGLKVAFQAGVLQVWLDEAGLEVRSRGRRERRRLQPGDDVSGHERHADRRQLAQDRSARSASISTSRELAKLVLRRRRCSRWTPIARTCFPLWGLDWNQIRASTLDATFNVYNFSKHELEVLEPKKMTEDLLCALCVAADVVSAGARSAATSTSTPVYLTDANLEEAIRRGADEIWVIWTVSDKSEWHDGFVANYFQIIETASVGRYRAVLKRIAANNAAIATRRTTASSGGTSKSRSSKPTCRCTT